MKRTFAVLVGLVLCGGCSSSGWAGEVKLDRLERFQEDNKFGFKDETGKVVIKPTYDDAGDFAFGLAPVNMGAKRDYGYHPPMRHGGRWGYINERGKVVVPFTLDYATKFSDGLAQVGDEQGVRYIDPEGKTVVRLEESRRAGDFSEGVAPVYLDRLLQEKDWQTKFINKRGEVAFTVKGYAEEFHEGLAVLIVRDGADPEIKRYGFIDHTGKLVIAPQFAEALPFSEGLAAVRTKKTTGWYGRGDTWGYINKSGQYVLKPQFNETHPFRNGVARVHVGGTLREYDVHSPPIWEGGEWQLIDAKGHVLKRSKEWVEYEGPAKKSLEKTR